jgi:hypothetical protein
VILFPEESYLNIGQSLFVGLSSPRVSGHFHRGSHPQALVPKKSPQQHNIWLEGTNGIRCVQYSEEVFNSIGQAAIGIMPYTMA